MPVVRTPSQKTPSYVGSWRSSARYIVAGAGRFDMKRILVLPQNVRRRDSGGQFLLDERHAHVILRERRGGGA